MKAKSAARRNVKIADIAQKGMRTKSAIKKRFTLMGSGIIKMPQAGKRHCMRKRTSRLLINNSGSKPITTCEIRRMSRGLIVGSNSVKNKSNSMLFRDLSKVLSKSNYARYISNTASFNEYNNTISEGVNNV